MRRLRYSVLGLMLLVAVVGTALGGHRMYRDRLRYLEIASYHAVEERRAQMYAESFFTIEEFPPSAQEKREFDQMLHEQISPNMEYHASMRKKYERAARYPWITLEGDPPEPLLLRYCR